MSRSEIILCQFLSDEEPVNVYNYREKIKVFHDKALHQNDLETVLQDEIFIIPSCISLK